MRQSNRIESLDSLRGISAIIVLIHHILLMTPLFYAAHYKLPYDNWIVDIFSNTIFHTFWAGSEAVLLFFVLSGFVLSLPFISGKDYNFKDYIIKRICRIYIPYISVMIIAVILMVLFADYNGHSGMIDSFSERRWAHPFSIEAAISYLLMLGYDNTNVNGPTWSLVHEMRISFFFPLIMLLVLRFNWKKSIFFGFGVSLSIWALLFIVDYFISNNSISVIISSFKDTFFYTTFFIIGAVFAKNRALFLKPFKKLNIYKKMLLLLVALVLFNFDEILPILKNDYGIMSIPLNFISQWIAALGVIIFFVFAMYSNKTEKYLTMPIFLWFGKISYSLYLVHMVVLITLMYTIGKVVPVPLALALVPIIAIPIAWIINKYIEQPSARLGNYLTRKKLKLNKVEKQAI